MQGILKSVPTQQVPTQQTESRTTQPTSSDNKTVHREFMSYFNDEKADPQKIWVISNWAMGKEGNIGTAFTKLKNLELKLGASGEDKINKMYNWVRLSNQVQEKENERVCVLSEIQTKSKAKIEELRLAKTDRLSKIKAEIARVEDDYAKAVSAYQRNVTEEHKKVKNEFSSILNSLKAMRDAYGGKK